MSDFRDLRCTAQLNYAWNELHIWWDTIDRKLIVLKPEFVEKKEFEICEPSLRLHVDDAQRLCDALFNAGLRPSKTVKAEGELAATKFHLEDMRKLVFEGK